MASEVNNQTLEDGIMKEDGTDLDLGNDSKVSEQNRKMEALEKEKSEDLAGAMERFKKEEAEMKERVDEMQREIDGSREDKKALQEVVVELQQLKNVCEELKQSNHEKDMKVEDLEKEKVSILGRMNREVEEIKRSSQKKFDEELNRLRNLLEGLKWRTTVAATVTAAMVVLYAMRR